MEAALEEARAAALADEVPVGAVLVYDGKIVARAHNHTRRKQDSTEHAEMRVLRAGHSFFTNERLLGCHLYVTKEPCAMCAGAIVNARVEKVVIGARDIRFGACGTVLSVCGNEKLNHRPEVLFDVCGEESAQLLKDFFRMKRG